MSERLQKLIANAGYGSRRWAERLIEQGRISINNQEAKLGDKALVTDKVTIDGRSIDLQRYSEEETKVLILNKQAGVICSFSTLPKTRTAYSLSISELGCINLFAK